MVGNNIGKEGAKSLADALKKNISLKSIDLSGHYVLLNTILNLLVVENNIGNEGAKTFEEILKKNKTITELGLSKAQ